MTMKNFCAITKEENQRNVNFFTMANVQNYILARGAENTVKKSALSYSLK